MNILDYLKWRGDLSFDKDKYNEIDMAIFSQLSLLPLDEIVKDEKIILSEAVKRFKQKIDINRKGIIGLIIPDSIVDLFIEMAKCNRYKNLYLSNYINDIDISKELQISALTIDISPTLRCVSFSGTDDTIIGWKENLDLMTVDKTNAQISSKKYLQDVSQGLRKILVCGHSKGGNLALYSTLHCDKRTSKKIIECYSFDGPGLSLESFKIKDIDERIKKCTLIIPQGSVVGCLFNHQEKIIVVHSNENGLYQHDAFSWEVLGTKFVIETDGRNEDSLHIEKLVKEIIDKMDMNTRKKFSNVVYQLLTTKDSATLTELSENKFGFLKSYGTLDKEDRKMLNNTLLTLLRDKIIRKNLVSNIFEIKKK